MTSWGGCSFDSLAQNTWPSHIPNGTLGPVQSSTTSVSLSSYVPLIKGLIGSIFCGASVRFCVSFAQLNNSTADPVQLNNEMASLSSGSGPGTTAQSHCALKYTLWSEDSTPFDLSLQTPTEPNQHPGQLVRLKSDESYRPNDHNTPPKPATFYAPYNQ
jgi:hypothetical protein